MPKVLSVFGVSKVQKSD